MRRIAFLIAPIALFAPAVLGANRRRRPNDYSKPENWLCRPGKAGDACSRRSHDHGRCPGRQADARDVHAELEGADRLLLRLSRRSRPIRGRTATCRSIPPSRTSSGSSSRDSGRSAGQFAPMYRQVTLAGLRTAMAGGGRATLEGGLAYDDVLDAWNYYLKNDNNGRGVVLVGSLAGRLRVDPPDRGADRRQAGAVAARVRHPDGHDVAGGEGQGRRRSVQEHPALPRRGTDRLRHHVRDVPFDHSASGKHVVRPRHDGRPGGRLHESGGACREAAVRCTRT